MAAFKLPVVYFFFAVQISSLY